MAGSPPGTEHGTKGPAEREERGNGDRGTWGQTGGRGLRGPSWHCPPHSCPYSRGWLGQGPGTLSVRGGGVPAPPISLCPPVPVSPRSHLSVPMPPVPMSLCPLSLCPCVQTSVSPCPTVPLSPCLPIPMSLCPHIPMSHCLCVPPSSIPVSPCPPVPISVSPYPRVPPHLPMPTLGGGGDSTGGGAYPYGRGLSGREYTEWAGLRLQGVAVWAVPNVEGVWPNEEGAWSNI